jgi:hypothetical protein
MLHQTELQADEARVRQKRQLPQFDSR